MSTKFEQEEGVLIMLLKSMQLESASIGMVTGNDILSRDLRLLFILIQILIIKI